MEIFNITQAKAHLSAILARVEKGEEILISRADHPIAHIAPYNAKAKRIPGQWKGKGWIADNFDDPLPEEMQAPFEGRDG